MTRKEKKILMELLPEKVKFLLANGGKSLISRIYGIYKVKCSGMLPLYLILQKNNIQISKDNKLLSIFDLKGSKFQRQVLSNNDIKNLLQTI